MARPITSHDANDLVAEVVDDRARRNPRFPEMLAEAEQRRKRRGTPAFTPKQGQYLAFIHLYTRLHGRPPAEADVQAHFGTTAPSIQQMVMMLERRGLIARVAGQARSIRVLVAKEELPELE